MQDRMKLQDYIAEERLTASQFAGMIGVDPISVRRYLNGDRRPDWEVMDRIVKVTHGRVTPSDFMHKPHKRKRKRASVPLDERAAA